MIIIHSKMDIINIFDVEGLMIKRRMKNSQCIKLTLFSSNNYTDKLILAGYCFPNSRFYSICVGERDIGYTI